MRPVAGLQRRSPTLETCVGESMGVGQSICDRMGRLMWAGLNMGRPSRRSDPLAKGQWTSLPIGWVCSYSTPVPMYIVS